MPICTTCTHPTPYLYTIYNSEDSIRLEQCTSCHAFADPYVQQDTLSLWLDLILLKRDVYRHLLFNRGAGARRLSEKGPKEQNLSAQGAAARTAQDADKPPSREKASRATLLSMNKAGDRWLHILKLGSALIAVDAFIRWTHLSSTFSPDVDVDVDADAPTWNHAAIEGFLRILAGCFIETVGFHAGVMLASFVVLHVLEWARTAVGRPPSRSGIRTEFRYSHIPLTIFYTSLNKLLLLLLLAVWRPTTGGAPLQPQYDALTLFSHPLVLGALQVLDDDKLDREWIVRNVLGGMAAGFGLRVVLDCHPVFTTMVILSGWGVKTALANAVSAWVGAGMLGNEQAVGEIWLAYSIP
ncbi:Arv1-domain-containing protein [Trametopsis cervina]|nr:Arv1-domain-containing protein [Trametopsis cervina]